MWRTDSNTRLNPSHSGLPPGTRRAGLAVFKMNWMACMLTLLTYGAVGIAALHSRLKYDLRINKCG